VANAAGNAYLLSGGAAELERLRSQARVWEPAAEQLLDQIGVAPRWRCLDLGCDESYRRARAPAARRPVTKQCAVSG
jgi:hypothetical protein